MLIYHNKAIDTNVNNTVLEDLNKVYQYGYIID